MNLSRYSPPMSDGEVEAAAQEIAARADTAYKIHKMRVPQLREGETLIAFRRRVLGNLAAKALPELAGANFSTLPDSALTPLEARVIDQTIERFKAPEGPLRQLTTREGGRDVTRFYGSPEDCWGPFKQQPRVWDAQARADFVASTTGENAPGAVRAVEMLMSDGSTRPVR